MRLIKSITGIALAAAAAFSLSACSGDAKKEGNIGDTVLEAGDKIAEIEIEDFGVIKAKLFTNLAPNACENFIKLAEEGYYDGLKIHRVLTDGCIQGGSLNGDGTGGQAAIGNNGYFDVETNQSLRNFYGALGYSNIEGRNTTQFYIVNCRKSQDLDAYDPAKIKAVADEYAEKIEALEENDPLIDAYTTEMNEYTNIAEMFEKATDDVKEKYKNTGGYPFWDGKFTVFGQIFEGYDVVGKISSVQLTTTNTGELTRPVEDIIIASVRITEYVPPEPEPEQSSSKKK